MKESNCACTRFERLEGAATTAYISQFLERTGVDQQTGKTYYRCRVCSTPWARTEKQDSRRPSLVRQETKFNV